MSGRELGDGRYELRAPLAHGGMGEVWLGHDTRLDREIAVKFSYVGQGKLEEEHVRRFLRESRMTARLEHPGVPAVYDSGIDAQGVPYLVMQRVPGLSVADLIAEQGPLPIGWAAAIAAQVCAVLVAAHAASLIHRDLKPSNLMLQPDGCVKVLDFGLAVAPTLADFSRITLTGQPIGTPAYMAPEQVEANLSEPATDLYALGCTLHEMLTGNHVFNGSTAYSVMAQQVQEPPPRLRAVRPEVPAELERLVRDLLQKRPEDRPADAEQVYRRLVPFAVTLGALPGALQPEDEANPVRMYAELLTRAGGASQITTAPTPRRPERISADVVASRKELAAVRSFARQLVQESRFRQAADVLEEAGETARQVFGGTDNDVVRMRYDLANALFEGGDYRRAERVYRALAVDLEAGGGTTADVVFDCQVKAAICLASTGGAADALDQLDALLAARRVAYGSDDHRTLELRKQIAMLQLRSGHHTAARRTLTSLLADVRRLPGGSRPSPAEVADLIASIRRDG